MANKVKMSMIRPITRKLPLRSERQVNQLARRKIVFVIHLIDMDGAYIPDINIIEDASAIKPLYSLTNIRTINRPGIVNRNNHKKLSINKLCSCSSIWTIPYRAYYMSSNLDHVLYDKLNSNDDDKENDAYAFVRKYKEDVPGFVEYISNSVFSVSGEFKESWDFIKQDLHSLERHTNLGLCFNNITFQ